MGYEINSKTTTIDVADTTMEIELPSGYKQNDLIYIVINSDGTGTHTLDDVAYDQRQNLTSGGFMRTSIYWKFATSSSESNPTLTLSVASLMSATVNIFPDIDMATPFDVADAVTQYTSNTSAMQFAAITPVTDGCVILDILTQDATSAATSLYERKQIFASVNINRLIRVFGFGQASAALIPAGDIHSATSTRGATIRVALRNKSGGIKPTVFSGGGMNYVKRGGFADPISAVTDLSTIRATIAGVATAAFTSLSVANNAGIVSGMGETGVAVTQVTFNMPSAGALWYGVRFPIPASSDLDELFALAHGNNAIAGNINYGNYCLYLEDSAGNWVAKSTPFPKTAGLSLLNRVNNMTTVDSGGTIDLLDLSFSGFCWLRAGTNVANRTLQIYGLASVKDPLVFTSDVRMRQVAKFMRGFGEFSRSASQGQAQDVIFSSIQIGNGTDLTNFSGPGGSVETPFGVNYYNAEAGDISVIIYASSSDMMDFRQITFASSILNNFTIHASSSALADYLMSSFVLIGWNFTNAAAVDLSDATLKSSGLCTLEDASYDNFIFDGSQETAHAMVATAGGAITNSQIIKGTEEYGLRLDGTAGAYDLSGTEFSGGYALNKEIEITAATGAWDITLAAGQTVPGYTSAGATVNFLAPTLDFGFVGLIAGSQVVIFNTGTTTEVFRDNNSSTSETASAIPAATYDYTVMKAGYFPIRVTGVVLGASSLSITISQVVDRAYVASSGLAYGTTATLSGTTFAVTTATTVQNWYSAWIEFWIAQATLANKEFPILPFGPNSFSLILDHEFGAGSIQYLSRDGFRYLTSGGALAAVYCAILSQGVTAGLMAEYIQTPAGTVNDALATGNMDQVIQKYGDATHGNFDYRNYLQIKVQANGYRQAEVDVVSVYGTLEEQLYLVSLTTLPIDGLTLGDPAPTGLSITDDSAAPISWDAGDGAKNYSITITDSATNSGDTILRWLNYNLAQDATFGSKDPFYWPEMVLDNGPSYETSRGILHKVGGNVLAGIRVIRAGVAHPDFSRFQSNDGTYGTPPTSGSVAISGAVSGSRILVENVTEATVISNATGTGYSLTYVEGTSFTTGDTYKITVTHIDKLELILTGVVSSSGFTVVLDQLDDTVYTGNALDGSTFTGVNFNTMSIDLDLDGSTDPIVLWSEAYARYKYQTTLSAGITTLIGAMFAKDRANYLFANTLVINNLDVIPVLIGGDGFGARRDGASMFGSGNIQIDNSVGVLIAETGVSGLTGPESAQLMSLPSADEVADEVIDGANRIEPGFSLGRAIRSIGSGAAAKSSNGPANSVMRNMSDTADQLTTVADSSGNRTTVIHGP